MKSLILYDGYILTNDKRDVLIGSDEPILNKFGELFGDTNDLVWHISPGTCGLATLLCNLVPIVDIGTWLKPITISASYQDLLSLLGLLFDHANALNVNNNFYANLDKAFYKYDILDTRIAYLNLHIKSQEEGEMNETKRVC